MPLEYMYRYMYPLRVGGMVYSDSDVLCRKNGIREELTYSFSESGGVGRRVACTIIS